MYQIGCVLRFARPRVEFATYLLPILGSTVPARDLHFVCVVLPVLIVKTVAVRAKRGMLRQDECDEVGQELTRAFRDSSRRL